MRGLRGLQFDDSRLHQLLLHEDPLVRWGQPPLGTYRAIRVTLQ